MPINIIKKINRLFDEAENLWYNTFRVFDITGSLINVTVPREIESLAMVRTHLLKHGANLPDTERHRAALVEAIASEAPIVRRAAKTGWRDNFNRFVSHRYVVGEPDEETVVPPPLRTSGAPGQLEERGTLEGCRNLIAVAAYSTSMMVALCTVFAAPLLSILNRPSFGLVLFGPAKVGKSLIQLVAASLLGFGREIDMPSLNATGPGLLAAAQGFNDYMLPINEVGTTQGPKREIYTSLRDTTYALMNGQDVLRHPSWTGAGLATSGTFRVLPFFSSEFSPDAWAARNGETRDPGETARLIGLPVLMKGAESIFDFLPENLQDGEEADWREEQVCRLYDGVQNERGVAFRHLLEYLVGEVAVQKEKALTRIARFEENFDIKRLKPIPRDVVGKFALLYAGGLLGIDAGVLPLDKQEVLLAVRRACRAALAELPDHDAELQADLDILRGHLSGGSFLDLEACSRRQMGMLRSADGFHRQKGKGREYVCRAQVFSGWFATPLRTRRILEWLDGEGLLVHGRTRGNGRSNEWAQQQVTWPDETRQRSIVIYLPNGFDDLGLLGAAA